MVVVQLLTMRLIVYTTIVLVLCSWLLADDDREDDSVNGDRYGR